MRRRLTLLLLAELYGFGAFVFGGLALLGAAVTWTGQSSRPTPLSWALVALFALAAFAFGRGAVGRLQSMRRPAPSRPTLVPAVEEAVPPTTSAAPRRAA